MLTTIFTQIDAEFDEERSKIVAALAATLQFTQKKQREELDNLPAIPATPSAIAHAVRLSPILLYTACLSWSFLGSEVKTVRISPQNGVHNIL